jgi:hypothetical protein
MKLIAWIVPAAALTALGGCVVVSTDTVERNYGIADFDSISARAGVNVVLKQGPFSISAEGPSHKVDKLIIERQGSSLIISREPTVQVGMFNWSDSDLVTVVAPRFALIEASGGADVDVEPLQQDALDIDAGGGADVNADGLRLDTLRIRVSGGADVNAHRLTIATLEADSSGGADINVSGDCRSANVSSSGGADFRGEGLRCETATVNASGGGDAELTATASASGSASSGGDVRFYGNPTSFQKEESGGGDVTSGR